MSSESEISWILGKRYGKEQLLAMKAHSKSILKFTYRNRFQPIEPYNITDDSGWGCMIRVAQMMMAQILSREKLGIDWRLQDLDSCRQNTTYCEIVKMFADYASPICPYSIHHMVTQHEIVPYLTCLYFVLFCFLIYNSFFYVEMCYSFLGAMRH